MPPTYEVPERARVAECLSIATASARFGAEREPSAYSVTFRLLLPTDNATFTMMVGNPEEFVVGRLYRIALAPIAWPAVLEEIERERQP